MTHSGTDTSAIVVDDRRIPETEEELVARARDGDAAAFEQLAGRTEYWNDPAAPKPNSLVPASGVLAVDAAGRVLLQRRRDTGQWAIPMGKQELGETPSQYAIRETLAIHPTQWRQLRDWQFRAWPHIG